MRDMRRCCSVSVRCEVKMAEHPFLTNSNLLIWPPSSVPTHEDEVAGCNIEEAVTQGWHRAKHSGPVKWVETV